MLLATCGPATDTPKTRKQKLQDHISAVCALPEITVTSNLVASLITNESEWVEGVIGDDGELGLMQLLPATYKQKKYRHLNPSNSFENISIGIYVLQNCVNSFPDDLAAAVGAYNCGPRRMRHCLEGIRRLPKRTRLYIKKFGLKPPVYGKLLKVAKAAK